MQNRLKSPAAWAAITALIGFILGNYGLYDAVGLTDESYKTMVNLIFGVVTALGVFNNPQNPDAF